MLIARVAMPSRILITIGVAVASLAIADALRIAPGFCTTVANESDFTMYPNYGISFQGSPNTLEYMIKFWDLESKEQISPWHDIPLGLEESEDEAFIWVINEIPRGDLAKMETMTKRPFNPIMQDDETVEDEEGNELYDRPRYYGYGPSVVNYGSIPQTFEDSGKSDPITNINGDGDPTDSIEIGEVVAGMGAVYKVKVLGALPLMDGDETDWKIVTINENDPNATVYNDVGDVPEEKLETIYKWFRDYKTADGKGQLEYFPADADPSDHWYNATQAVEILKVKHENWMSLMDGECEDCDEIWVGQET